MSQARVPPGFRFHPTDEELLSYYLRKKTASENFEHVDIIKEVDLNKLEPWELHEKCRIGWSDLEEVEEWYFFSHKDKKYPSGSRTNRATGAGFWKATGRDKPVSSSKCRQIGMRKTLVFYKGRAPHGRKTEWIMHEYRLSEVENSEFTHEEGWVVCHVFKKYKHQIKPHESISTSSSSSSSEYQKLHSTKNNNSPKKKTKSKTSTTSTSIRKTTTNTNTNTNTNELILTPPTPPICKQELVDQPELYQYPNSATNTTTNTSTNTNTTTNTNTNTNTTNQDPTVHVGDITYLVADIESSLDNFTHSSFKTDWNLLRSLATEARFITFSDEPTRQHPLEYPSSCNVDLWSFPK